MDINNSMLKIYEIIYIYYTTCSVLNGKYSISNSFKRFFKQLFKLKIKNYEAGINICNNRIKDEYVNTNLLVWKFSKISAKELSGQKSCTLEK